MSNVRTQLVKGNWDEESKSETSALTSFGQVIAFMGQDKVGATFKSELTEAFKVAKARDEEIKSKKAAGG